MYTFLDIISVVYVLWEQGQNYLFFSCVLRKQKACVLTIIKTREHFY